MRKKPTNRKTHRDHETLVEERERESFVEDGGDDVMWCEETCFEENNAVLHEDGDEERTMDGGGGRDSCELHKERR